MKLLPKYLREKHQQTGTLTFAVLFAVIFLNLYIPFSDTAWFRLGNSVFFLFTTGFLAISIIFLTISRIIMYKTRKLFDMTFLQYVLWALAEVLVICSFYTFITVDVAFPAFESLGIEPPKRLPVLNTFLKAFVYCSIAILVPYTISTMYFIISEKDKTIRLMAGSEQPSAQQPEEEGRGSLISLFDNSGTLKLSVRSSRLYYLEADDNYIKVWYDDGNGALKMYLLRCRLKTVEESFQGTRLVRCNRKYIVNLDKVKVLHREADGYYLDLDNDEIAPISVTKTYSENILKHFSAS